MSATAEQTNELGIANSSARLLPTGTVCLSRTASVGYCVVTGAEMATSQDFVNFVCSPEIDPRFLQYLFIAEGEDLLRFASGSVHQTIYFPEAKAFWVCIPTRKEQRRIVGILDEAFEGIATAKANAEQTLSSAEELLDRVICETLSGDGPEWRRTTIADATGGVFTGPFGSLLHKHDYVEGGIPLINPAHITESGIEPETKKSVTATTARRLSAYRLKAGDIVIGRRGEMGRCAVVGAREDGWLCGTGSFFIRPAAGLEAGYLVRYLRSSLGRRKLEKIAGGAVMPNLSNMSLGEVGLWLPPVTEQRGKLEMLELAEAQVSQLRLVESQKLAALDALKQSLLHHAFTGQL